MKKIASLILALCVILGTALCLTSCKKEESRSKTAVFSHIGLKYSFDVPEGLKCVIDNNNKEVVWIHNKKNAADWKIIVTLIPGTEKDFTSFDVNQRAFVKSNTAESIAEGVYLYDYDVNPDFSTIYAMAYYDKAAECIVFLKATDDVAVEISKEFILNAVLSKI